MRKTKKKATAAPRGLWRILTLLALIALMAALAACGDDSNDGGTSGDAKTTEVAETNCKPPALRPAEDPDGALAQLPQEIQERYAGYTSPVYRSNWVDFRPRRDSGWRIGLLFGTLVNPAQQRQVRYLEQYLGEIEGVEKVITLVPNEISVPQQLQQFRSILRQDVDLIVFQPIAAKPFIKLVDQAARAGIPTITVSPIPSPNAVNVGPNVVKSSADLAEALVTAMGGGGKVLEVEGVRGFAFNDESIAGYRAVFEGCPDIEVVGNVVGQYTPPVAKSQTLQFLATHPGRVDGVAVTGATVDAVMQAFRQAGREIPPTIDTSASLGTLVYWQRNSDTYRGVASASLIEWASRAAAIAAERMLHGDGPLVSDIVYEPEVLTVEDLDAIIPPGTPESSTDPAVPPPGAPGEPTNESLAPFFASGAKG